jgi:hypothetical protein
MKIGYLNDGALTTHVYNFHPVLPIHSFLANSTVGNIAHCFLLVGHRLLCQNARTNHFLTILLNIFVTGYLRGANSVQHGQQDQEARQGGEKEGSTRYMRCAICAWFL